jgi:uncharacterized protein (TIGR02246 family)
MLTAGLVTAGVIVYFATQGRTSNQACAADDAKPASRQADEAAIQKLGAEFASAFEKSDAAAIASLYTTEGEFIRNDGETIRGPSEIEKAYAAYFKGLKGKKKLEVQSDSLRFPSADTAIAEVTLRLKDEDNDCCASSWRETLLVREGGKWKVAVTREWDRDMSEDTTLKEVEWLIGNWEVSNKDRQVNTSYEWDENKAFIRGKYTVKEGGKVVESGTQIIGKDNNDGVIRSWAFQSDGGFGGGVWTREGKKWTVDVHGVLANGQELTATNVYIHLDPNTYSWQSVNRKLDDEPMPDTPPIKVTKQKSAK